MILNQTPTHTNFLCSQFISSSQPPAKWIHKSLFNHLSSILANDLPHSTSCTADENSSQVAQLSLPFCDIRCYNDFCHEVDNSLCIFVDNEGGPLTECSFTFHHRGDSSSQQLAWKVCCVIYFCK